MVKSNKVYLLSRMQYTTLYDAYLEYSKTHSTQDFITNQGIIRFYHDKTVKESLLVF